MENIESILRRIIREELETFFADKNLSPIIEYENELITINQAAEFLKLSIHTLYGLTMRGEIPFSKNGKRVYFSKPVLIEWIKKGKKKIGRPKKQEYEKLKNK